MTSSDATANQPEARILVVDDEPYIADLLATSLRFVGFDVRTAGTGREALATAETYQPELLVLDVMLPDLDGFDVLRRLRASGRRVPVVFLTARDATEDKVSGLTIGGDDYVTKPFSLEEVIARIRAVLRRSRQAQDRNGDAVLRYADLELDEDTHEVRRGSDIIRPVADRVRAVALSHGQRWSGAVQGADPRPRLVVRLRRRRGDRGVVHQLPAPQDRP